MRKVPIAPDVDASIIARGTPGFSGADLANLVNEAALFAARGSKRLVDMDDFERAKDKVIMGAERRSMVMPEEERRNTAYHESGHAIVARLLPKTDPVHKVTIIPRGRALGVTMQLPVEDRYSYDRDYLLNNIAVLFGGRIAEELFMNQMTTGASNDFKRATEMARRMVTEWGMTDALGPMVYGENEGEVFLGRQVTTHQNMSEETMKAVDQEVRAIIDQQYALARQPARGEPRQGRGDDQGAARVGDARRRPDQRHHGRHARRVRRSRWRPSRVAAHRRRQGRGARADPGARGERLSTASNDRSGDRAGLVAYAPFSSADARCVAGHPQRHRRLLLRRRAVSSTARRDRARLRLREEGADLVDVGGESTRPGARARAGSTKSCAASFRWSRRWSREGMRGLGRHDEARGDARGDRRGLRDGERRERASARAGAIEAVARRSVALRA